MSDPAKQLGEEFVRSVAAQMGVNVDPEQVAALVARAALHLSEVIGAKAWRDAKEAGDLAASKITTLEQAEESAKRTR